MAFRIKPDEDLERGIRRIVREQIDKALGGLAAADEAEPDRAIHDARKRFKKVRAVLRLARGGLGRRLAKWENARFRDAGRPLSEVRDAGVLVEAFDRLVGRSGPAHRLEGTDRVRAALVDRRRALVRRVLDDGTTLKAVTSIVEDARKGQKHWEVEGDGGEVLGKGLKRIYRSGREAFRAASSTPSDEALHEWRKRVKDLWYAVDILGPVRPGFFDKLLDKTHRLADALGDDHDLAVLRLILEDPDAGVGDRVAMEAIGPMIGRRREELQAEARRLGEAIYVERPRTFAARFDAYWRAWRAESEAARFDPLRASGREGE